jgi:hypothetical protein
MKTYVKLIFTSMVLLATACYGDQSVTKMKAMSLKEAIDLTIQETSTPYPWTVAEFAPYIVFDSKHFLMVYENPCSWIEEARELLEKVTLDERQEIVLAFMFYKLPPGEYLEWMKSVKTAFEKGQKSRSLLEDVVFPDKGIWPEIYFAYRDKKVSAFYSALASDSRFEKSLRERAQEVVSGKRNEWIISYLL